jgi:hypothetical protein
MKEILNVGDKVIVIEPVVNMNLARVEKGSKGVIVKSYNLDFNKSLNISTGENRIVKIKFGPASEVMVNASRLNVNFKKIYVKEKEAMELIL